MSPRRRPTLHVLAGPNGAGKSTLYRDRVQPYYPGVEFVNADLLAKEHFGHNAETPKESLKGQELAEARRAALMEARKDLVTESTFSHPSKLDLIRDAADKGYRVVLYHVNVRSPEISVKRVQGRVLQGGHPVPEEKIRERYERNQQLIRAAAMLADRAFVFDNSVWRQKPRLAFRLDKGVVADLRDNVPAWARELYKDQLANFTLSKQNPAAFSFAEAKEMAKSLAGTDASVAVARHGLQYAGKLVAETSLHLVQQLDQKSFVAHLRSSLPPNVDVGQNVQLNYIGNKAQAVALAVDTRASLAPRYAAALDELRAQQVEARRTPGAAVRLSKAARDDLVAGADATMALKSPGLDAQRQIAGRVAIVLASIDGPNTPNPFTSPALSKAYTQQQRDQNHRDRGTSATPETDLDR